MDVKKEIKITNPKIKGSLSSVLNFILRNNIVVFVVVFFSGAVIISFLLYSHYKSESSSLDNIPKLYASKIRILEDKIKQLEDKFNFRQDELKNIKNYKFNDIF